MGEYNNNKRVLFAEDVGSRKCGKQRSAAISISSISSINASIDSLPGDYLFFVADSKTSHYFSKTYEEHLNKINELGLNK